MVEELWSLKCVMEPLVLDDEDDFDGGKKFSNECYFWLEFFNHDLRRKNDFLREELQNTKDGFINWNFLNRSDNFSPIDQYRNMLKHAQYVINEIHAYPVMASQVISPNYFKNLNKLAERVISDKMESINRARAHYKNPRDEIAEHYELRVREDLLEMWKQIHHEICKKNRILPPILKYSLVFLLLASALFCWFQIFQVY